MDEGKKFWFMPLLIVVLIVVFIGGFVAFRELIGAVGKKSKQNSHELDRFDGQAANIDNYVDEYKHTIKSNDNNSSVKNESKNNTANKSKNSNTSTNNKVSNINSQSSKLEYSQEEKEMFDEINDL